MWFSGGIKNLNTSHLTTRRTADGCYEREAQTISSSRRTRTSQDVLSSVYSHSAPPSPPRVRRRSWPRFVHERLVCVHPKGQVVPNTINIHVVRIAWRLLPATSVATVTQCQHRHRPDREESTYSSNVSVLGSGVGPIVQHAVLTGTLNRVFNVHQRYMTARG